MALIGAYQVDTASIWTANVSFGLLAFVDVFASAIGESKSFVTLAKIGAWEILTISMTTECGNFITLVNVKAGAFDLKFSEPHVTFTGERTYIIQNELGIP